MNKNLWGLTAGLTLVVMVAVAEPVPPTFELCPAWVAGLSGSGTLHGQDVKYDRSTGDLWNTSKPAAHWRARCGTVGIGRPTRRLQLSPTP